MAKLLNTIRDELQAFGLVHAAGLAATGLVLLTGWYFAYEPASTLRAGTQAEATNAANQQRLMVDWQRRLTALEERHAEKQHAAGRIGARLKPWLGAEEYYLLLVKAAEEAGVELKQYRPGDLTAHEWYDTITIQVTAEGEYHRLCRFCALSERLPRASRVLRHDVLRGSGNQTAFHLTFEVFAVPERGPNLAARTRTNI